MKSEHGVTMAYHHHKGTLIEKENEIDALMAATGPAVGLLADSGHIAFAGGDPVRLLTNHATRIRYIHCKDLRPEPVRRAQTEDWPFPPRRLGRRLHRPRRRPPSTSNPSSTPPPQ